jgi:hypothetical protein
VQIRESAGPGPCLSILDFSHVRVMDYSCADEIVAKLLLRYASVDRPVDAYFLARGLHAHHLESVHAVLDRHGLLLAVLDTDTVGAQLLGPCTPVDRDCWSALLRRGWSRPDDVARSFGLPVGSVTSTLRRFVSSRVAVAAAGDSVCALPRLGEV